MYNCIPYNDSYTVFTLLIRDVIFFKKSRIKLGRATNGVCKLMASRIIGVIVHNTRAGFQGRKYFHMYHDLF